MFPREDGLEESGQTLTDGYHPSIYDSGGRGPADAVSKIGICEQQIDCTRKCCRITIDDPSADTIFDEVLDPRTRYGDNRSATALGLGDRTVTAVRTRSGEENHVHGRVELGQRLVLISGPVDPPLETKLAGLSPELR